MEQLIETGESETIFQKAILERGRGQVLGPPCMLHTPGPLRKCSDGRPSVDGAARTGRTGSGAPWRCTLAVTHSCVSAGSTLQTAQRLTLCTLKPWPGGGHAGGDPGAPRGGQGAGEEPPGPAPNLPGADPLQCCELKTRRSLRLWTTHEHGLLPCCMAPDRVSLFDHFSLHGLLPCLTTKDDACASAAPQTCTDKLPNFCTSQPHSAPYSTPCRTWRCWSRRRARCWTTLRRR